MHVYELSRDISNTAVLFQDVFDGLGPSVKQFFLKGPKSVG